MAEIYEDTDNTEEPSAPLAPQDAMATGRVKLEAQIRALQDSLSRRSQMPFDPTLMALATGFLKPTQTGSFGESLGYAGEGAMGAAEKERARKSDLEKMKLELALKQYELTGDAEGQKILGQVMSGAPASTVAATREQAAEGAAATAGAEGTGKAPTQDLPTQEAVDAIKANPNAMFSITMKPEIVAAISRVSPKWGGVAQKIFDNQTKMAGIGQKERELAQKDEEPVTFRNPEDPSDTQGITVRRKDIPEMLRTFATGDKAKIRAFLGKIGTPGYVGFGKTVDGQPSEFKEPQTKAELEVETGARKVFREKQMQERSAYETSINNSARDSKENIQRSEMAKNLATDEKTKNAFGIIASKPGMQGAVLQFMKDPIHFGEVHVGISNIEDLIRQANGTKEEIEAAQALDNIMMPIQLSYRRNLMKDTGPVSDMETAMTNKMNAQLSDTSKIIRFKSDMIIARAEYDRLLAKVYKEWSDKNPYASMGQFINSTDYNEASDAYIGKLGGIDDVYFRNKKPGSSVSAQPKGGSSIWEKIQNKGSR